MIGRHERKKATQKHDALTFLKRKLHRFVKKKMTQTLTCLAVPVGSRCKTRVHAKLEGISL
jgi:hypothetical protein